MSPITDRTADDTPRLSELLADATGQARLRFEPRSEPVGAAALAQRGASSFGPGGPGRSLALLMTNDEATVQLVLGAILAGVRLVSLPLPSRTADPDEYVAFVRAACAAQGASEVVARDDVAALLESYGVPARPHGRLAGAPLAPASPSGFELVQFSSGSTARPKAVALDDRAIGANVAAILGALEPRPGDALVSWLPLSHDMGLIGMLLTSLAAAHPDRVGPTDIAILEPTQFLRRPAMWMEAMSELGCTFTAAPDFGYRLCVDRAPSRSFELGPLRCVIVGGETIRARTLARFTERFADDGFRSTAFCPAYGMAEIGLAATMTPMADDWRELTVQTAALGARRLVPDGAGDDADDDVGDGGRPVTTLVSSGVPLVGYEVECEGDVDEVGVIRISGPSIGRNGATGEPYADESGWLRTGDLGSTSAGWLYVSGRADDQIVANGRNIYAPAVEEAIGTVPGVRAGRAAVVGLPSGECVVVAERDDTSELAAAGRDRIRKDIVGATVRVIGARPDRVLILDRGTLPITPSGKLQRAETIRQVAAGTF